MPALDSCVEPGATAGRALAVVVARDEEPALGGVLGGLPREACGMPVDVLLVDDGSHRPHPRHRPRVGARVVSHEHSRGLGAGLRTGLELARDEGYAAAVYLDGDGEYDPPTSSACSTRWRAAAPTTWSARASSGERDGMTLAPQPGQPRPRARWSAC